MPTSTSSSATTRRSSGCRLRPRPDVKNRVLACAVGFVLVMAGSEDPAYMQTAQSGARSIVVVSDLHMGIGKDPSGEWNPTEDFRWAAEFAQFLETIDRAGQSR